MNVQELENGLELIKNGRRTPTSTSLYSLKRLELMNTQVVFLAIPKE